jgi:hypothetical protein
MSLAIQSLRPGIVKPEELALARQRLDEHVPAAMNTLATI